MMIIRLIILIALVSLLIFVYRKLTRSSNPTPQDTQQADAMRKCDHCGVHLPEAEACRHKQLYFCSPDHRQAYLEQHPDE
ncbi:PP0621 family protein [Ketobacter sp.]|uniref:PP0621 family protein n=1 Tax=Ketobacter sp. TaxID=2083498 RepID=UPI000F278CD1|nr:PP0621 family protein [Ketobacter sp.]RLU00885.1 MAG: hypothetical protein D9N14_04780 [Ketobacter sp.]